MLMKILIAKMHDCEETFYLNELVSVDEVENKIVEILDSDENIEYIDAITVQ